MVDSLRSKADSFKEGALNNIPDPCAPSVLLFLLRILRSAESDPTNSPFFILELDRFLPWEPARRRCSLPERLPISGTCSSVKGFCCCKNNELFERHCQITHPSPRRLRAPSTHCITAKKRRTNQKLRSPFFLTPHKPTQSVQRV